jgi:NAD(P)-dependent dehydrogenase (short-subunit alcohol dehydrogenase family)
MSEFAGRRYIVTGAASGIGQVVAERLLEAGAEVCSLDRNGPTAAVTRQIDDIVGAIVFVASDAARWIHGHPLVVDGGIIGAALSEVVPAPEI